MEHINLQIAVDVPTNAVENLYQQLSSIVGSGTITVSNIVGISFSLMQIVEKYKNLKGEQKKAAVIKVLDKFILERLGDAQESRDIRMFVHLTLPGLIDTLVSLDRHKLKIKVKSCSKKLECLCL